MSPNTRKLVYKLAATVLALVGVYFGISQGIQDSILELVTAALGIVTAIQADRHTQKTGVDE